MNGLLRKCRQADRNVLCPLIEGGAVPDPFVVTRDDGLAGMDLQRSLLGLDQEHSPQHQGELVKCRLLPRLGPPSRTLHPGDADPVGPGVHPPDVLLDELGSVPG